MSYEIKTMEINFKLFSAHLLMTREWWWSRLMFQFCTKPNSARSTAPMDTVHTVWDASSFTSCRKRPSRPMLQSSSQLNNHPLKKQKRWRKRRQRVLQSKQQQALVVSVTNRWATLSTCLKWYTETSGSTTSTLAFKKTKRSWRCTIRK